MQHSSWFGVGGYLFNEHTIAGINQNHIARAGVFKNLSFTHSGEHKIK
jgi:hypothetical protein